METTKLQTNEVVSLSSVETTNLYGVCALFHKHYPSGFLKKVVAEIIATFLLVFVTCGAGALSAGDEHKVSQLGASVAGGLVVTVMIYAVGHISGAHMNPAVTLAFAAVRHFPWNQVPFYAAAQLTGSIGASFTLKCLLHPIKHIGTTSPSGTYAQALVMEIVVTFSMMFITSAVATDTKAILLMVSSLTNVPSTRHRILDLGVSSTCVSIKIGELAGIAVGSAVCITSILAGPISGGSMNPARSIGPAIASGYYKAIWVYLIGPVLGTLFGAWTYKLIRVTDQPVQAISPRSFSFKLRRMRSSDVQLPNKDPFTSLPL